MARQRADVLVVDQGLAPTRSKARSLILAGVIIGKGDRRIDKPGELLAADEALRVKGETLPYVSRGGLKLAAAIAAFDIDVGDAVCLDVGASTGGFTDCLLQHGARRVYAVDVGYGQLAWSLRQDPRVVVIERENIRHMPPERVPEPCDCVVFDVSFISLQKVVPAALRFVRPGATLVALVKPQFEVGRADVGKGGIVRDEAARRRALHEVEAALAALGVEALRSMESPVVGAKGNREWLLAGQVMVR